MLLGQSFDLNGNYIAKTKVETLASDPALSQYLGSASGAIYNNSTSGVGRYYNGTEWVNITNIVGVAGKTTVVYSGNPLVATVDIDPAYIHSLSSLYLPLSGGTVTGTIGVNFIKPYTDTVGVNIQNYNGGLIAQFGQGSADSLVAYIPYITVTSIRPLHSSAGWRLETYSGHKIADIGMGVGGTVFYDLINFDASIRSVSYEANRALISDGNKTIAHSVTTSTELSYLSGATSNIQQQLNNKTDITTLSNYLPLAGGQMTGVILSQAGVNNASNAAFTANAIGMASTGYNWILRANNDVGQTLSIFTNGSTRTLDGGVGSVTIRNESGIFNLGASSYNTNYKAQLNVFDSQINVPRLTLNDQPDGTFETTTPSYYIGQMMAGSDGWKIYGEGVSNNGKLVFEITDDATESIAFRNKGAVNSDFLNFSRKLIKFNSTQNVTRYSEETNIEFGSIHSLVSSDTSFALRNNEYFDGGSSRWLVNSKKAMVVTLENPGGLAIYSSDDNSVAGNVITNWKVNFRFKENGVLETYSDLAVESSSVNGNYAVAPIVMTSQTNSAAIGFHNSGTQGVMLYLNRANSEMKLNWNNGNIATILHTINHGGAGNPHTQYQLISEKGNANGYASLDGTGKVPLTQLPDSILGQVTYMGTWNAATNTPDIGAASIANKGDYYIVTVAGSGYNIGDWVISNGTSWDKVDNTDAVFSVFGRTGAVTADANDYSAHYVMKSVNLYGNDLNNYYTSYSGRFDYGAGGANKPSASHTHYLFVAGDSALRFGQIAIPYAQDDLFYRSSDDNGPRSWYYAWTNANIPDLLQIKDYVLKSRIGRETYNAGEDGLSLSARNSRGISFGRMYQSTDNPTNNYCNYILMPEAIGNYNQTAIAMTNNGPKDLYFGSGSGIGPMSWVRVIHNENMNEFDVKGFSWTTKNIAPNLVGNNNVVTDYNPPDNGNPFGVWSYNLQLVHSGDSANWKTQLATSFYNDRMAFRRQQSGAWQAWRELYHSGNFNPNQYLPLSGGTMTGTIAMNYGNATFSPSISFTSNNGVTNGKHWEFVSYDNTFAFRLRDDIFDTNVEAISVVRNGMISDSISLLATKVYISNGRFFIGSPNSEQTWNPTLKVLHIGSCANITQIDGDSNTDSYVGFNNGFYSESGANKTYRYTNGFSNVPTTFVFDPNGGLTYRTAIGTYNAGEAITFLDKFRVDRYGSVTLTSNATNSPGITLKSTGNAADSNNWDLVSIAGALHLRTVNDAVNSASDLLVLDRAGINPSNATFHSTVTLNNTPLHITPGGTNQVVYGGDGANFITNNIAIKSWQGVGFGPTIAGQIVEVGTYSHYFNVRTGDMGIKGLIEVTGFSGNKILITNGNKQIVESSYASSFLNREFVHQLNIGAGQNTYQIDHYLGSTTLNVRVWRHSDEQEIIVHVDYQNANTLSLVISSSTAIGDCVAYVTR